MGSLSPSLLPIIDFSELEQGSSKWNSVKAQVQKALEEYGCFKALFPKVSSDVRKSLFGSIEDMFGLPLETKLRNSSEKPFEGYSKHPSIPLYETMAIDKAHIHEKVEAFTDHFWPQGNPSFRDVVQSYSVQLTDLDQTIRRMIIESLGLRNYLDEHMDSTYYTLRLAKYQGPKTNESEVGLNSHTDKGMLTILCQNQVDGLEVQTKDGEWISSMASADSFIVMIGDSLHAWTNGRLHAPYHRVMMEGSEARYSTAFFSAPRKDYIIKAPEELIDEQHPLLYKPYDISNFMDFYYSGAAPITQSALKAYCGV